MKNLLRKWLGLANIERRLNESLAQFNEAREELKKAKEDLNTAHREMADLQEFVKGLVDVGVDINPHDGSWAVVCLKGRPEYVKFVDLGKQDIRVIVDFLKRFEYNNLTIDSPFSIPVKQELMYKRKTNI